MEDQRLQRRRGPDRLCGKAQCSRRELEDGTAGLHVDTTPVERDDLIGRAGRIVKPDATGNLAGCARRERDVNAARFRGGQHAPGHTGGGSVIRRRRGRMHADIGERPRLITTVADDRRLRRDGSGRQIAEDDDVARDADAAAGERFRGQRTH